MTYLHRRSVDKIKTKSRYDHGSEGVSGGKVTSLEERRFRK